MVKLFVLLIVAGFSFDGITKELLVVRGDGFYPPYEMIIDNSITGFHIDIVASVADRMGLQAKFKTVPWKRAIQMIKKGNADAITYMSKTKERSEFVYFHKNNILSYIENGFFTLKDRFNKIEYTGDYHQLMPYRIGKLAGYAYDPSFDGITYLKQISNIHTEEQLLNMLTHRRIDIAIGDISRINYIAQQQGNFHEIEFLNPPISRRPQYLAFSKAKSNEQFVEKFANEMARFKQSERFQQLLKKYKIEQNLR